MITAHNKDDVGKSFNIEIDGINFCSSFGSRPASKNTLKSIEQAGGPSLRMYMAYFGNLTAPFGIYKMETLKLESETAKDWVLTAEYIKLPAMPHWLPNWTNRLTIDKTTGLIRKLEAITREIGTVILLDVKRVSLSTDNISEYVITFDNSGSKNVKDEEALGACLMKNDIKGGITIAKRIAASGADVNNTRILSGISLLHLAAGTDDVDFAQLLISKGADVNAKNLSGDTLLMSIVRNSKSVTEKKEAILFLVEKGVDINATYQSGIYDIQNKTALDEAILSTQPEEIITLLKSNGAKTAAELKAKNPAPRDGK